MTIHQLHLKDVCLFLRINISLLCKAEGPNDGESMHIFGDLNGSM